jgi:hypothetical protein
MSNTIAFLQCRQYNSCTRLDIDGQQQYTLAVHKIVSHRTTNHCIGKHHVYIIYILTSRAACGFNQCLCIIHRFRTAYKLVYKSP